ncbi:hypothetical protein KA005_46345 [bacterium]|nr:hypothetical protein [bacterium]
MKINAYGHQLSLKRFIRLTAIRLFCTHKKANFHACTKAHQYGDNVHAGVSFVCPKCLRSWMGDIYACIPDKEGG